MSAESNLNLVRRMYEALNAQDLEAHHEFWHDDMIWHGPPGFGDIAGLDGFRNEVLKPFYAAFPDYHVRDEIQVASGDWVSATGFLTGHHRGEWLGDPPHRPGSPRAVLGLLAGESGQALRELGDVRQLQPACNRSAWTPCGRPNRSAEARDGPFVRGPPHDRRHWNARASPPEGRAQLVCPIQSVAFNAGRPITSNEASINLIAPGDLYAEHGVTRTICGRVPPLPLQGTPSSAGQRRADNAFRSRCNDSVHRP